MSKEAFAADLMQCLEPIQDDCLCMDPPGESAQPADHSDYCPVYLYHYCRRVAEGTANNPASQPAGKANDDKKRCIGHTGIPLEPDFCPKCGGYIGPA